MSLSTTRWWPLFVLVASACARSAAVEVAPVNGVVVADAICEGIPVKQWTAHRDDDDETHQTPSPHDSAAAWISCDGDGSDIDYAFVRAVQRKQPVVFWSSSSDYCRYSGDEYADIPVYTAVNGAASFARELRKKSALQRRQGTFQDNNFTNSSSSSTSVALIILYSVTGIITALFLVIIVIGAIRAHRHPERYGPRAITRMGRARQSRAKGIARAVLDTIPIVRFGSSAEEVVAKTADVELASGSGEGGNGANSESPTVGLPQPPPPSHQPSEPVSAVKEEGVPVAAEHIEESTSQNQCSVCMEDFERGQEVRVLPCHHTFHPDCIDPWLLNISGSCPLCRIDLHPEPEPTEGEASESAESAEPAPLNPRRNNGNRLSRLLDVARVTRGEERMAALRQIREENRNTPRSRRPELGISRLGRAISRLH